MDDFWRIILAFPRPAFRLLDDSCQSGESGTESLGRRAESASTFESQNALCCLSRTNRITGRPRPQTRVFSPTVRIGMPLTICPFSGGFFSRDAPTNKILHLEVLEGPWPTSAVLMTTFREHQFFCVFDDAVGREVSDGSVPRITDYNWGIRLGTTSGRPFHPPILAKL